MEKQVAVWANNYYGKCLGTPNPIVDISDANAEKIAASYDELFLVPLKKMLSGTEHSEVEKEQFNHAIVKLDQKAITDWIYLLKYWVDNEFFVFTGNFDEDLNACIKKTQDEMRVLFATAGINCRDIALHTYNGRIIDILPMKLFVYPRGLRAHYNGRLLRDVAGKNPVQTTAVERAALASAVEGGFLGTEDLATVDLELPMNNGDMVVNTTVRAIDSVLPPKGYTDILFAMSPITLGMAANSFMAIYDYAQTSPVEDEVKNYINAVRDVSNISQFVPSSPAALTDDAVLEYLQQRGIYAESLEDVIVKPLKSVVATDLFDSTVLEGSAQDLIDAIKETDGSEFVTFDEAITNYCKEWNIDTACTIAQLIEHMNYEVHPQPLTTKDLIASELANTNTDPNTTLTEYVNGWQHKDPDPIDTILDYMVDSPLFPENVAEIIRDGLIHDKLITFPNPDESFIQTLGAMNIPDHIKNTLIEAVRTGAQPQWPIATAAAEPVELSREELDMLFDGNVSMVKESDDEGYLVGEYLLDCTRTEICKDASYETRSGLTPILYTFLRLLMCDMSKERDSVIEYAKENAEKATGKGKQILEEALLLFK